jgi:predicted metalloprotease
MEERFGHTAMKERYMAEAKLRKRQSLRDFGQALEDLYRRTYPENPNIVEENAMKAFLDKCGQSEDFRLAVKMTRPPRRYRKL